MERIRYCRPYKVPIKYFKNEIDCEGKMIPEKPIIYVYDFAVPGTEVFVALNGIPTKNTLNNVHSSAKQKTAINRNIGYLKKLLSCQMDLEDAHMFIYLKEQD